MYRLSHRGCFPMLTIVKSVAIMVSFNAFTHKIQTNPGNLLGTYLGPTRDLTRILPRILPRFLLGSISWVGSVLAPGRFSGLIWVLCVISSSSGRRSETLAFYRQRLYNLRNGQNVDAIPEQPECDSPPKRLFQAETHLQTFNTGPTRGRP